MIAELEFFRLYPPPHWATPPPPPLRALFSVFLGENPNSVHPAARSAAKNFFSVHVSKGVYPITP